MAKVPAKCLCPVTCFSRLRIKKSRKVRWRKTLGKGGIVGGPRGSGTWASLFLRSSAVAVTARVRIRRGEFAAVVLVEEEDGAGSVPQEGFVDFGGVFAVFVVGGRFLRGVGERVGRRGGGND
jgi:hypothetical protein